MADDARLAWISVALTFNLVSVRGWTLPAIAKQIGVPESTLARNKRAFEKLVGGDVFGAAFIKIRRNGIERRCVYCSK